MFKTSPLGRFIPFFILTSCVLFFVLVPRYQAFNGGKHLVDVAPRQLPPSNAATSATPSSVPPTTTTSTQPSTPTPTPTPTTTQPTPAQPTSTPTTTTTPTNTQTSATTSATTTPTAASSNTPPPTAPSSTVTQVETTNANGQIVTIISTVPYTPPNSGSTSQTSPTSSSTGAAGGSGGSGMGTGSIIGLSVSGGVALIGIIAFIVWKFTRKRFSDRFDDSEAIKWPELNHENHALPTHPTGGAGFSDNLSRAGSVKAGYAESIGAASQSQVDLYAATDPYAVPPLPHLNPNHPQAYRDDPNASGYYDPFPGPAPPSFHDLPGTRGEAIPLNQIPPGSRARSPGPHYGMSSPAPSTGRQSPGSYGALRGPAGYGAGRQSPGPNDAYGYGK